jgi:hypothetical protein
LGKKGCNEWLEWKDLSVTASTQLADLLFSLVDNDRDFSFLMHGKVCKKCLWNYDDEKSN